MKHFYTKQIEWNTQTLTLCNQRVLFWENKKQLIFSDLHLGKTRHFRQNGFAVPEQVANNDLERLSKCVNYFSPSGIIIAGDFFHAGANAELHLFNTWRKQFKHVPIQLIKGNHDRLAKSIYDELNIEVHPMQLNLQHFMVKHYPTENNRKPEIVGHIHPGVILKSKAKQRLKFPCFYLNEKQIILPAFSKFTGLDTRNSKSYQVFAFHDEGIFEI